MSRRREGEGGEDGSGERGWGGRVGGKSTASQRGVGSAGVDRLQKNVAW